MSALLDELLVIRCQLGERDAFDALVLRWHAPVWSYVSRVLAGDSSAPDVAQDVWLRVVRGIARLQDPQKFRSWLFGVAHRAVMDHLRRKYASQMEVGVDVSELAAVPDVSAVVDPADEADLDRELEHLDDALQQLPVTERDVLVLFYLKELSLADIADVLSVPIGTVKSRLHRARHLLRGRIGIESRTA
jgi:RNA polymerase sigma factor (sigma-70 family)